MTLALDVLDRRVRQMHASLAGLGSTDLSRVAPQGGPTVDGYYWRIDFSGGLSEVDLYNIAEQLVANIARMKDHLKQWCIQNAVTFTGDVLINGEQSVALVHDLWNTDKHAALHRPPRSGHKPRIENLQRFMSLSAGTGIGGALFSIDPRTGSATTQVSGGGSVGLTIDGDVVDEHGTRLGSFATICEEAVGHWETALRNAGVPVPAR